MSGLTVTGCPSAPRMAGVTGGRPQEDGSLFRDILKDRFRSPGSPSIRAGECVVMINSCVGPFQ